MEAESNLTLTLYFHWAPQTWGYFCSATAAMFLGTYAITFKARVFQKFKPDPMVILFFMSFSIFVSSWLILLFVNQNFTFSPLGIISASLWLTSNIFNIFGRHTIGIGATQGVASVCAIIMSFIWGHVVFGQTFYNFPLSILGLVCLIAGIAGMTIASSDLLEKFFSVDDDSDYLITTTPENDRLKNTSASNRNVLKIINNNDNFLFGSQTFIGVICAFLQGITQGTMFVPMFYVEQPHQLIFIANFGIGVIVLIPIFSACYFIVLFRCFKEPFKLKLRVVSVASIMSGILWNIGNWACIFATLFLGMACGYPLSQSFLVVNSIWKIVFKEIKGVKNIGLLLFSMFVLLAGATLLGTYVTPPSTLKGS